MIHNRFLSASPVWFSGGVAFVRIVTGGLVLYHGLEVFDADKIKGYAQWLTDLKFPAPMLMAYLGKGAEFIAGLLLLLGFLTRLAAVLIAITMAVICFGMGHGKFYMDDQHPFLFILLSALFFFTGPGKWSLDRVFFNGKNRYS